jgi:hypothetical protein
MRFLGTIAVLAVTASIAAASGQTKQATQPDVAVTHWSDIAAAQLTPMAAPRFITGMAIVDGAIYDAVNAIDRTHEPFIAQPAASPTASLDAAVATAGYRALLGVLAKVPAAPAPPASLATDYANALNLIPDGQDKTDGIAAGEAAATSMLLARDGDGRYGAYRFEFSATSPAVGAWRPEPSTQTGDPNAWLKNVTPFAIVDPSRYGSHGPNDLTSKKYAEDFNEVKDLGAKTGSTRTAAQTEVANFWAVNPPRLWWSIARTLATNEQLSTVDAARYYALTFMAATDTLISVWTDKALWLSWRPVTAIREAANDGNPDTAPASGWLPYLATPPYPDQPSGHTSLATAVTITAQRFFGTDKISFSATNTLLNAVGTTTSATRDFTSLSQARDEVVEARILQGIHFRRADEDGVDIGKRVTDYVTSHLFKPVD